MTRARVVAVGLSIVVLVVVLVLMVVDPAARGAGELGPFPTGDGDAVEVTP